MKSIVTMILAASLFACGTNKESSLLEKKVDKQAVDQNHVTISVEEMRSLEDLLNQCQDLGSDNKVCKVRLNQESDTQSLLASYVSQQIEQGFTYSPVMLDKNGHLYFDRESYFAATSGTARTSVLYSFGEDHDLLIAVGENAATISPALARHEARIALQQLLISAKKPTSK